jgi:hypothetical protein
MGRPSAITQAMQAIGFWLKGPEETAACQVSYDRPEELVHDLRRIPMPAHLTTAV